MLHIEKYLRLTDLLVLLPPSFFTTGYQNYPRGCYKMTIGEIYGGGVGFTSGLVRDREPSLASSTECVSLVSYSAPMSEIGRAELSLWYCIKKVLQSVRWQTNIIHGHHQEHLIPHPSKHISICITLKDTPYLALGWHKLLAISYQLIKGDVHSGWQRYLTVRLALRRIKLIAGL